MNVFAIRHGETAWSLNGRHTGTTDIPLTDNGRRLAGGCGQCSRPNRLACSLQPDAAGTTDLRAGRLGDQAVIDPDLVEWNYGKYEGLTPKQIQEMAPGWLIFRDGCPGGETPEQVGARVDRVIARSRAVAGDTALFAHGHLLRVFAARWIGLPAIGGQHFLLKRAPCACSVTTTKYRLCGFGTGLSSTRPRDDRAIRSWNTKRELESMAAIQFCATQPR